LGLAEGGEFERLMLKFTIMFNRIPNAQTYDSAPLLANPSYVCIVVKFNNKSKRILERTKAE
jgi:hypothetical protein